MIPLTPLLFLWKNKWQESFMPHYKWRCGHPPPDNIFKKLQMANRPFAAFFVFDSFRQDFLTDFRKSCRKLLNYSPAIFKKQKILSRADRKREKNLFSAETYHPARAPPLESDIKIHFQISGGKSMKKIFFQKNFLYLKSPFKLFL